MAQHQVLLTSMCGSEERMCMQAGSHMQHHITLNQANSPVAVQDMCAHM